MGVLLSVEEWDSKPEPAFEMDISDLAGLIEDSWSVFPGSFRERCCSTLIMASFSMIWACRVLILWRSAKKNNVPVLLSPWTEASVPPCLGLGLPSAFGEAERGCQWTCCSEYWLLTGPPEEIMHETSCTHAWVNSTEIFSHPWLLEAALKSHARGFETKLNVMGRTWDQQKEA